MFLGFIYGGVSVVSNLMDKGVIARIELVAGLLAFGTVHLRRLPDLPVVRRQVHLAGLAQLDVFSLQYTTIGTLDPLLGRLHSRLLHPDIAQVGFGLRCLRDVHVNVQAPLFSAVVLGVHLSLVKLHAFVNRPLAESFKSLFVRGRVITVGKFACRVHIVHFPCSWTHLVSWCSFPRDYRTGT